MLNPERTLAIVCGAREWPNLDNFEAATAFANSAKLIRSYLSNKRNLGLTADHILWLFDKSDAVAQYVAISNFLQRQFVALNSPRGKGVLILFFYVGHGAFFGSSREYCLLVKGTRTPLEADTSLRVASLARLFRALAPDSSRILFLDCCFAGEAARLFLGGLDQSISAKVHEVVEEAPADSGVALLCASSARNPATMESLTSYTLFGRELFRVLTEGDSGISGPLSLRQLCELVRTGLRGVGTNDVANPELHVPVQTSGDLGASPLFPNPAWNDPAIQGRDPSHISSRKRKRTNAAPLRGSTARDNSPTQDSIPVTNLPSAKGERATEKSLEQVPLVPAERSPQEPGTVLDPQSEARLFRNLEDLDQLTSRPSYLEHSTQEFDRSVRNVEGALRRFLRVISPGRRSALEPITDDFVAAADSVVMWMEHREPGRPDERDLAAWGDLWRNLRAKLRELSKAVGLPESAAEADSVGVRPAEAEARLFRNLEDLDQLTSRPSYLEHSTQEFDRSVRNVEGALRRFLRVISPGRRSALEPITDDFVAAADSVVMWMEHREPGRPDERDLAAWGDLWRNLRAKLRELSKAVGLPESAAEADSVGVRPAEAEARLFRNLEDLDQLTSRPSYLEHSTQEFDRSVRNVEGALRRFLRVISPGRRSALEPITDDFVAAADSVVMWMEHREPGRPDERDLAAWGDLWRNLRAKLRELSKAVGSLDGT